MHPEGFRQLLLRSHAILIELHDRQPPSPLIPRRPTHKDLASGKHMRPIAAIVIMAVSAER